MKGEELLHALNDVEDRFLEEAAPVEKKKGVWKYLVAASAACLILMAGILLWPKEADTPTGRYKYTVSHANESGLVLRWEDKTLAERYGEMIFSEISYKTRSRPIEDSLVGEKLGVCQASGYDIYTDQIYTQEFEVYAIAGIQNYQLVAVFMEDTYYVFLREGYMPEETLGQLMQMYNLAETLPMVQFSYHLGRQDAYYTLNSGASIWPLLQACADAPVAEDVKFTGGEEYLSFTITSEPLGIYKRALYVTADGYVKTNALDYGYAYFIGQEQARNIMEYALSNATETEPEPYQNSIAGTITEIGDGYLLISDAVLCWDPADGITFRVDTTAPEFSRWLKYYKLQVGDVVYIQYAGQMQEENLISGAFYITEAVLYENDILIME